MVNRKRPEQIRAWATKGEKARVIAAAEKAGLELGEWIRETLLDAARQLDREDAHDG